MVNCHQAANGRSCKNATNVVMFSASHLRAGYTVYPAVCQRVPGPPAVAQFQSGCRTGAAPHSCHTPGTLAVQSSPQVISRYRGLSSTRLSIGERMRSTSPSNATTTSLRPRPPPLSRLPLRPLQPRWPPGAELPGHRPAACPGAHAPQGLLQSPRICHQCLVRLNTN